MKIQQSGTDINPDKPLLRLMPFEGVAFGLLLFIFISVVSAHVSGQSKPATKGRMKTSHFEGSIAPWAAWAALGRNERTQRELAAFDINFGGQRLVQPADCA